MEFFVWYTTCAVVEAVSIAEFEKGNFTVIRHCNIEDNLKHTILENLECIEEIKETK